MPLFFIMLQCSNLLKLKQSSSQIQVLVLCPSLALQQVVFPVWTWYCLLQVLSLSPRPRISALSCMVVTAALNLSWRHPWLYYSLSKDGVYCKACALFAPSDIREQKLCVFVSKPFNVWTKKSSTFLSHEKHSYHQDSVTRMVAFRDSPSRNIACIYHGSEITVGVCLLLCKTRPFFSGSQGWLHSNRVR